MSPRLFRLTTNLYPPYPGTGIRVARVRRKKGRGDAT